MPTLADVHKRTAPFLSVLGKGYGLAMRIRESLYARGAFSHYDSPVPTVSVGNISMGGSGKTPLCSWLLGRAIALGQTPVLLTRGYKAEPPILPYTITGSSTPKEAGDEPLMLAWTHPSAKVVVDPERTRAARFAEKKYHPDLFILDDGFQHMAMGRDVNLCLMRPADFTEQWNRVFPGGEWREPASALHRAHGFLVRCEPEQFEELAPVIRERLAPFSKPVFNFFILPDGVLNLKSGETKPDLGGEPYALVSGIGDPAQAAVTAEKFLGSAPLVHMAFKDHHAYTAGDVQNILKTAHSKGCARILTTPKDGVKLGPLADDNFWTLRLTIGFGNVLLSDVTFDTFLDQALKSATLHKEKAS